MRKILLALVAAAAATTLLACSSSGVTVAVDARVDDTALPDVADAATDASATDTADTLAPDTDDATSDTPDTPGDVAPTDTTPPDTAPFDAGPPDTAGTFACGTERCGSTFQVCQVDTAPGTGRHCVAIPSACFAFPACPCVVTKLCGGALKGTCTDDAGAITFQCTP